MWRLSMSNKYKSLARSLFLGKVGIDVNAKNEFCQHHVELYQLLSTISK